MPSPDTLIKKSQVFNTVDKVSRGKLKFRSCFLKGTEHARYCWFGECNAFLIKKITSGNMIDVCVV